MKRLLPVFIIFIFSLTANSQIAKNSWLVSGNVSFATQKNSSAASVQYKQTDIQISPTIGYFLADNFAAGVRPSFTYGKNNLVADAKPQTIFSIGPFARYYFLKNESPFNLLAEAAYAYGSSKLASNSQQHSFSFAAGPVLYFNTSVGLEFLMGYSTAKVVNFSGRNTALRFGIGFQIHLEKEQ